jgi:hypothetical protein
LGAHISPTRRKARPTAIAFRRSASSPANGFVALTADGNTNDASHLNFKLSGDQGEIALFASDGILVDHIIYGPQTRGIAEGGFQAGRRQLAALILPHPADQIPAASRSLRQ